MIASWSKFRSLLRRPVSAQTPAGPVSATPAAPHEDVTSQERDAMRSTMHALATRVEDLERLPTSNDKQMTEALAATIDELRVVSNRHAQILADLREMHTRLDERLANDASGVAAVVASQRAIETRLDEADTRSSELQQSLDTAESALRRTRQEMIERDAARDRQLAGRLAGLYIVGFVALVAALATLVMVLTQSPR